MPEPVDITRVLDVLKEQNPQLKNIPDKVLLADPKMREYLSKTQGPSMRSATGAEKFEAGSPARNAPVPGGTPGAPPGAALVAAEAAPAAFGVAGAAGGGALAPGIGASAGGVGGYMAGVAFRRKLYDAAGIDPPENYKLFGLIGLGKFSRAKETAGSAAEALFFDGFGRAAGAAGRALKGETNFAETVGRARTPENMAVTDTAEREGIKLRPSEAYPQLPKSRGSRYFYEGTTKGAVESQERVAQLAPLIKKKVADILESVAPGVDRQKLTEQIQRAPGGLGPTGQPVAATKGALDQAEKAIFDFRKQLYDKIFSGNRQPIVDLREVDQAATNLSGKLNPREALRGPLTPGSPGGFRDTVYGSPQGALDEAMGNVTGKVKGGGPTINLKLGGSRRLTLEQADILRSDYGYRAAEAARQHDMVAADVYNELKRGVDAAMDRAAKGLPGNVDKQLREARAFVEEYDHGVTRGVIRSLGNMAPEKIAESLKPNDVTSAAKINEVLSGWANAGKTKDAFTKLWLKDYMFNGGEGSIKDIRQAWQNLDRLETPFKDALFDSPKLKEMYERAYQISKLADRVDFGGGTKGVSGELQTQGELAQGLGFKREFHTLRGMWQMWRSHALVKVFDDPDLTQQIANNLYVYPQNPGRATANILRILDGGARLLVQPDIYTDKPQ
jgi:hypothetical protein